MSLAWLIACLSLTTRYFYAVYSTVYRYLSISMHNQKVCIVCYTCSGKLIISTQKTSCIYSTCTLEHLLYRHIWTEHCQYLRISRNIGYIGYSHITHIAGHVYIYICGPSANRRARPAGVVSQPVWPKLPNRWLRLQQPCRLPAFVPVFSSSPCRNRTPSNTGFDHFHTASSVWLQNGRINTSWNQQYFNFP